MKRIILLLSLFVAVYGYSQTEVLHGVTRGKEYGVVYTLPKSEISLTIKTVKHTYTPGEYCRYADRYLRLNNISADPEEYWEIESITATARGVADNSSTYFVKMKDRTVAPLMELTPEGFPKSINVPYSKPETKVKEEAPKQVKKSLNPRDFLTEEILMASSSAKMAELVAKEIYNIRESRNALLRGQADNTPKDGEQLRIMLEHLQDQEDAMVEMFAGKRTREEKTQTIKLSTVQEMRNEVVFRFSKKLGILPYNDLAGSPIYMTLTNLKSVTIPQETEQDKKKKPLDGIAYNVPGKAQLTLTDGKQKFFEGEMYLTQFGVREFLAPVLFNKNSTIKVIFDPATGGIFKVERE